MTVLFVEDDPIYADFVRSSITTSKLPVRIFHASNLDDALTYLEGKAPHTAREFPKVVLLDIGLSKKSGFDVLRWLRQNGHLEREKTRVIMLTASDRMEDRLQALELGALSYLVKSPSAETVIGLLHRFAS